MSACRCVEAATWTARRGWCPDCEPETIELPTLGVIEANLEGRICLRTNGARQRTAVVVSDRCLALSGARCKHE